MFVTVFGQMTPTLELTEVHRQSCDVRVLLLCVVYLSAKAGSAYNDVTCSDSLEQKIKKHLIFDESRVQHKTSN